MLSQLGSEPLAKFRASSLPFFLPPKIAHSYHKSRVPMNCEARQRFLFTPMVNHSWPEIYIELFLCGETPLFVQFIEQVVLVKVFISTCVGWMEIHNWKGTKLLLRPQHWTQSSTRIKPGFARSVSDGPCWSWQCWSVLSRRATECWCGHDHDQEEMGMVILTMLVAMMMITWWLP